MNDLAPMRQSVDDNYPVDKLILSHSSRGLFRDCARKFEFIKLYTAMVEKDDDFAAQVGKAIHAGFQTWLVTQDEDQALFQMLLAYPHDLEPLGKNNYQRSLEATTATMLALMNSHLVQPYEIAKIRDSNGETRDAIEVPFAIEITDSDFPLPVWYVGFIDCILFNRLENRYIVVDIKSTRQYLEDFEPKYRYDEQCIPYGIILEHALGLEIGQITVSYLTCFIDLEEPKVQLHDFIKDEDSIYDWHRGLAEDIELMARYFKDHWWKRVTNGSGCVSWNRKCSFSEVCYERKVSVLKRMIQFEARSGLFHDDTVPWVTAKLSVKMEG